MAVIPATNRVYVSNDHANYISVLDDTGAIIDSVWVDPPEGGPAKEIAVNTRTNRIYVVYWLCNIVTVIDGASNTVEATLPVGGKHGYANAVAVNPVTNRIYVGNQTGNDVWVFDGNTDDLLATVAVDGYPLSLTVSTATNQIYVLTLRTGVQVIDGRTNAIVGAQGLPLTRRGLSLTHPGVLCMPTIRITIPSSLWTVIALPRFKPCTYLAPPGTWP